MQAQTQPGPKTETNPRKRPRTEMDSTTTHTGNISPAPPAPSATTTATSLDVTPKKAQSATNTVQDAPQASTTSISQPSSTTTISQKSNTKAARSSTPPPAPVQNLSPVGQLFDSFRIQIDSHHERRDRIIKASRDITALSKKLIFALQRGTKTIGTPLTDRRVLSDISRLKSQIEELFKSVVPDLQGLDGERYARQISGGVQEYMEAVLFAHYLATFKLMSHEEAKATLPEGVQLGYEDYVLGVFDFTGEVMKTAITGLATTGVVDGRVLTGLREVRAGLEGIDTKGVNGLREWDKKLDVCRASVEKVERAVYEVTVRGKERPKGWMPEDGGGGDNRGGTMDDD